MDLDTWMLAHGTGSAMSRRRQSWFFLTATMLRPCVERDTEEVVVKEGAGARQGAPPLNAQDFSSFLLQAQSSKAQVIGLANAGGDTINSIKQASEFRYRERRTEPRGMLVFISDVHAWPADRQGLIFTRLLLGSQHASRAFAKRFAPQSRAACRDGAGGHSIPRCCTT